jgi:hypothetical protein
MRLLRRALRFTMATTNTCPGRPGRLSGLSVFLRLYVNRFSIAVLYERAGRLTAKNGDFRPGQCRRSAAASRSRPART